MEEKKVINLGYSPTMTPDQVLAEGLKLDWEHLCVMGFSKEHGITILTSHLTNEQAMYLLEIAKSDILLSFWEKRAQEIEEEQDDE